MNEEGLSLAETIKQISRSTLNALSRVSDAGPKTVKVFTIDCTELEDYNNSNIREAPNFEKMFVEIEKMKGPVLYYFEILSEHTPNDIVNEVRTYSKGQNSKNTPPTNTRIMTSNVLYVGKVKGKMWGRLIQHLGFYKVNGTQGLQLFYWAKEMALKLQLTIFEFEPEMSNIIGLLEFELASRMKPILGRHK